ncbi:hypothetical protein Bbelb_084630 [Branchiostoma belcheri]|nr:hypothetical protein Bbelb_084630 [Branchiostoma belcheri]
MHWFENANFQRCKRNISSVAKTAYEKTFSMTMTTIKKGFQTTGIRAIKTFKVKAALTKDVKDTGGAPRASPTGGDGNRQKVKGRQETAMPLSRSRSAPGQPHMAYPTDGLSAKAVDSLEINKVKPQLQPPTKKRRVTEGILPKVYCPVQTPAPSVAFTSALIDQLNAIQSDAQILKVLTCSDPDLPHLCTMEQEVYLGLHLTREQALKMKESTRQRSQNKTWHDQLTLQTYRHYSNAEKVTELSTTPPLRVRRYHRHGAPKAGIMIYARIGGDWLQVGWVRESDREAVEEMARGTDVKNLRVTLWDADVKRGYCVLKMSGHIVGLEEQYPATPLEAYLEHSVQKEGRTRKEAKLCMYADLARKFGVQNVKQEVRQHGSPVNVQSTVEKPEVYLLAGADLPSPTSLRMHGAKEKISKRSNYQFFSQRDEGSSGEYFPAEGHSSTERNTVGYF